MIELEVSDEQFQLFSALGGVNWLRWHVSPLVPTEKREMADYLRAWVTECCDVRIDGWVASGVAYDAYRAWRPSSSMTHRAFALRLVALGFASRKRGGERGFTGLALK